MILDDLLEVEGAVASVAFGHEVVNRILEAVIAATKKNLVSILLEEINAVIPPHTL